MERQTSLATNPVGHEPGDVLRRRKGLVMHTGVSLGDGRVLHNTPRQGEHVSSLEEFRKGKRLHVSLATAETRHRVESLDIDQLDREYNLLTNNCEHTTSRITDGKASSPQLKKVALEALAAAALMLVLRKPLRVLGARVGSRLVKGLLKASRS